MNDLLHLAALRPLVLSALDAGTITEQDASYREYMRLLRKIKGVR